MQALKLVSKQVKVTQSQIQFNIGKVTSANFELHYRVLSDTGAVIKKGILHAPIAEIDIFNASPVDVAKVNVAFASLGVEVDSTQPLSTAEKFLAKQKATKDKIAQATEKNKAKRSATQNEDKK